MEVVVVSGDGAGTTVTMSDTKASSWACSPAAISTLQRKLKNITMNNRLVVKISLPNC